jgi:ABC-2 type transport system permease protein
MRLLDIALKDMLQVLREKSVALFQVAMPVAFTFFMALAYWGAAQPADPRLALGWVNQDAGGLLVEELRAVLAGSGNFRLVELQAGQAEEAARQVSGGELAGALVIPTGFSQQALAGGSPQMVLVTDPMSGDGQTVLEAIRTAVTRLMSAAQIAYLHTQGLQPGKVQPAAETEATFKEAAALWRQVTQGGPKVVIEKAQGKSSAGFDLQGNPYNQSSPGMLVMFAVFGLINSANVIVLERKNRTLERMLTASLSRAEIIGGHLLATFAISFIQQLLLVVFGQLVLQVNYFREPLGALLVMTAVALWAAGLGLLIGVVARSEERVILLAMVAMFLFSALGGAWFPLEGAGQAFTVVGRLTPTAWAMTGFQNILIRGLDATSVLLPTVIILAWAAAFFGLAVWRFKS